MDLGKEAEKIYVFYADVFWFRQFLTDWAILFLLGAFRKKRKTLWKSLWIAGAEALLQTLLLLGTGSVRAYRTVTIFLIQPAAVWAFLRENGWKALAGDLFAGLCMLFFLGGLTEAAEQQMPGMGTGALVILAAVLLSAFLLRWLYEMARLQKNLYPLVLSLGEKQVRCIGFWDTGNRLRMAQEDRPVHLVSENLLRQLNVRAPGKGFVTYHTVGQDRGILEVFEIEMALEGSGKRKKVLAASVGQDVFEGRSYQVILNTGEFPQQKMK